MRRQTALLISAAACLTAWSDRLVTDSIAVRKGEYTRAYCTYFGNPHTSNRIESATLSAGKNKLDATDIDGVDFKRYFQWEDEGAIKLEIDFAPIDRKRLKNAVITLDTLHGKVSSDAYKPTN